MLAFRASLLVAILVAGEGQAGAQSDRARALEHYKMGTRLYSLSEYEGALREFKEAYKLKDDPAFLFNIAQCHRRLGNTGEATVLLRRYLKKKPPPEIRAEAERMLAEIEAQPRSSGGTHPAAVAAPAVVSGPPGPAPGPAVAPPAGPPPAPPEAPPAVQPWPAVAAPAPAVAAPAPAVVTTAPPPVEPAPPSRLWLWASLGVIAVAGVVAAVVVVSSSDGPACRGIDPCLRLTR